MRILGARIKLLMVIAGASLLVPSKPAKAQPVPQDFTPETIESQGLIEGLAAQGIVCSPVIYGERTVVVGDPHRWWFPVEGRHLSGLTQVGPIGLLSIKYQDGFDSEHYHFLPKVPIIRQVEISHYTESHQLIEYLGQTKGLQSIKLGLTNLKPSDLEPLSRLPKLKKLRIRCKDFTADHLDEIVKHCRGLQELRLTPFPDFMPMVEQLEPLAELSDLTFLQVNGGGLTEEEKKHLQKLLGECEICFTPSCPRDKLF